MSGDRDRTGASWRVEQEGFDAAREHEMESLFTVGNGYLGVRGALDEPLPGSRADLYAAGVYDRKHSSLPYSELEFMTDERGDYAYHELVPLPFPFRTRIAVDGTALNLIDGPWTGLRRTLALDTGVLRLCCAFEDEEGRRTVVESMRCASLADPHLCLQEVAVTCENHTAELAVDLSIGDVDLADAHPHLSAMAPPQPLPAGVELHLSRTRVSGYEVAIASRARHLGTDGESAQWRVQAPIGVTQRFRRQVLVYTSRDGAGAAPAVLEALEAWRWEDFDAALKRHAGAWAAFWDQADLGVLGSPATEQALRFNAYHLRIATDADPRTSVPARTLSGRAYEGHVFWDVEIFMLPFYLHTVPEIARALLGYRHLTLPGARERAAELGCRGACYAWESTVTGLDVTPRQIVLRTTGKSVPIFTGTQQIHVTADVACGVWRYWRATRDAAFMREAGVEILAETARFWASRCQRGPRHFHIRGVVGPDEYHHGVDDNAYTNWLAWLNLERAWRAVRWLAGTHGAEWEALAARLQLDAAEIEQWRHIAELLLRPQPDARGVIEQFAGFFDLEDRPLAEQERFRAPLERLFDWEQVNRMQIIKQADVLMLLYLLPERFGDDVLAANYRFYEPRTDHGSSLSPPVHAAIAARLGLAADAERYWRQSLWFDLSNVMNNSALGVHAACMGGTWQALVFGFLGVQFTDDGPVVDRHRAAHWPADWQAVELGLHWNGARIPISVRRVPART